MGCEMRKHLAVALIISTALLCTRAYGQDSLLEVRPEFTAGAGYGITYGGLGVDFETSLVEYVGVVAGFGYTSAGVGWAVGARAYPIGRRGWLNPRLGAYRGVIGVIERTGVEDETHVDNAFGAGFEWNFSTGDRERKDTLDFEVLYLDYKLPEGYDLLGSDVRLAVGYRFRF